MRSTTADRLCGNALGVGVHQHFGAVTEQIGDGPQLAEVGRTLHHVGRRRVPQPVRGEAWELGIGHDSLECTIERAGQHEPADPRGDDEILVLPALTGGEPFRGLCGSPPAELAEGLIIERDDPAGSLVLRVTPGRTGPCRHEALVDPHRSGLGVEVLPAQREDRTSA
jgi:hypothetical protein